LTGAISGDIRPTGISVRSTPYAMPSPFSLKFHTACHL
jgi:hypothetical protein